MPVRPRERRKPCSSHPCKYKGIRTLQRGRSLANVGSRCDAFLGGADERRVASLTHIGTEQSAQLVLAHGAAVLIVKVRGIQRILRSELNAFPVQLGASFVILLGVLSGARLGAICEAPRKPFWDPSGIHLWPYLEGIFGQNCITFLDRFPHLISSQHGVRLGPKTDTQMEPKLISVTDKFLVPLWIVF